MMLLLLRWVAAIVLAFFIGKLVSKLKLPSILGWLVAGMILGPHALKLMPQTLMDGAGYQTIVHVLECAVGTCTSSLHRAGISDRWPCH